MPAPFQVRDQDRPGVDLGQWGEDGSISIPGTLTATGITGPSGSVVFAGMVAAFVAIASTDVVMSAKVAGDAATRYSLDAAGKQSWGGGGGAADITLNRYAAGGLEISGALRFTNGQLLFGAAGDVNLYRGGGATELKTDNNLNVVGNSTVGGNLAVTGTAGTGALTVTGAVGTSGAVTVTGALSTTAAFGGLVTGDTFDRYRVQAGGRTEWGPGNGARDTALYRSGVGLLATDTSIVMAAAGGGLQVKEGSNATMGISSAMVAGTTTVSTTKVTANSRIFLTAQTSGAAPGALRISARSAGTSFTITSTSGTDTSTVAWLIMEPAA